MSQPPTDIQGTAEILVVRPSLAGPSLEGKAGGTARLSAMAVKTDRGEYRQRGQRGFSLIELLIALGILGFIGAALMSAFGGALRAQDTNREQVRGQNLARAVLESIRFQAYAPPAAGPYCYTNCYTVSLSPPSGYTFTIKTEQFCTPEPCTPPDHNVQKNSVTIYRGGALLTISDLKTRR